MNSNNLLGGFLLSVTTLFAADVSAVSDSYVSAVTADVREFETGEFHLPEGSPWIASRKVKSGFGEKTEDMRRFEEFFLRKFRGTYIQYRGLSAWKQQQVYEEYRKTGDMEKVRKLVLRTLTEE
jgi:hypothetical protein